MGFHTSDPFSNAGREGAVPVGSTPAWLKDADHRQALAGLLSRYSTGPRWLTEPAPDHQALQQALACALRAPDHGQLVPWRAVLIESDQREALGECFARFARDVGKSEDEVDRERERAHKGPVLVAWVARITPGIAEAARARAVDHGRGRLDQFPQRLAPHGLWRQDAQRTQMHASGGE